MNAVNKSGETPIAIAAENGNRLSVKALLSADAKVKPRGSRQKHERYYLTRSGNVEPARSSTT